MAALTPDQRHARSVWAQAYVEEHAVPLAALHWHTWQTRGPGHLLLCPTPTELASPQWVLHNAELYASLRVGLPSAFVALLADCDPCLYFVAVLSMVNLDGQNDEYFVACTPTPTPPECAVAVRSQPSEWLVSHWRTD